MTEEPTIIRDKKYFRRRPKLCIRCGEAQSMPSSSYCQECQNAFNRMRYQEGYKHPPRPPKPKPKYKYLNEDGTFNEAYFKQLEKGDKNP